MRSGRFQTVWPSDCRMAITSPGTPRGPLVHGRGNEGLDHEAPGKRRRRRPSSSGNVRLQRHSPVFASTAKKTPFSWLTNTFP